MRAVLAAMSRNRPMMRLVGAYSLFAVNEYSVWIGVLVYAYAHGGATEAGVVSVVQLVPAALCAPLMAVLSDRHPPARVLLGGLAAQCIGLAVAAVAVDRGWASVIVYAGAVVAATSLTAIRPAQAALLPTLARTPDELTAANIALSWVEAVAVTIAGVWSAAFLASGVGQLLAAAVLLVIAAAWLVAVLPMSAVALVTVDGDGDGDDGAPADEGSMWSELRDGARAVGRTPGVRSLVGLLAAQDVVLGGLDVLFVVVAFRVLHDSQSWVGYLNGAYGLGGMIAGGATIFLIGRRLPTPIVVTAVIFGGSLAAISLTSDTASVVGLLILVGMARTVMDTASRTLLQRSVAPELLGRVFGLVEGLSMATLALGSIAVPALIALGGPTAALVCIGAVLPVVVLLNTRQLLRMDREGRIPVTEIALLRSVSLFARLPAPGLEAVARSLTAVAIASGDVVIHEGEHGDLYYVVVDGRLTVTQAGLVLRTLRRGSGFGEIALLRASARTATVTADCNCQLMALSREVFLSAMTGHTPSRRLAESVVAAYPS